MWLGVPVWYWVLMFWCAVIVVLTLWWLYHYLRYGPAHEAPKPLAMPDLRNKISPRAATMSMPPWGLWESELDELPVWAAPEADRVTVYGIEAGSHGSDYGAVPEPGDWTDRLLADLHDAPTVLDGLESSGSPDEGTPEGDPGLPASGTERGHPGAGDESEASGPPAPPALAGDWLDQQLAALYRWVRSQHEAWETA